MECSDDTDVDESASKPIRLTRSSDIAVRGGPKNSVKLWKRALHKLQSVDLDPWLDFHTHDIPVRTAIRHRYSVIKKKWVMDEIQVKLESSPFDRGAMRECFRVKKMPQVGSRKGNWHQASNYVAKRYITQVDRQVYFDDVRLQTEAKLWGEAFNRQNPPKKVDIFQLSVLELRDPNRDPVVDRVAGAKPCDGELYHIERFMEGEYRKYNSNSGFVDEQLRNTPQAFSHFTFERSGHRLLVVDIQGVGDLYTDPQIHTSDGIGYSDGNLGPKGMAFFFHSHRCNPLCEYLGLTPFDLAPTELNIQQPNETTCKPCSLFPAHKEEPGPPADLANSLDDYSIAVDDWHETNANKMARPVDKVGCRRRSNSFNYAGPSRFGPTVARSTENMTLSQSPCARRRGTSVSFCSDGHQSQKLPNLLMLDSISHTSLLHDETLPLSALASLNLESDCSPVIGPEDNPSRFAFHSTLLSKNDQYPKPLLQLDYSARPLCTRNRISSGDSGYSGLVSFLPTPFADGDNGIAKEGFSAFPYHLVDPNIDILAASTTSLVDFSLPSSPSPMHPFGVAGFPYSGSVGDEFGFSPSFGHQNPTSWGQWNQIMNARVGGPGGLLRRRRNLSESSDIDAEEVHRGPGNLFHQLMHESHKPSCADHPTNLDQEIGQSILGQIHHELARLHEAGRFLARCKGGWSHAGLGGFLLRDGIPDSDCAGLEVGGPNSPSDAGGHTIDWAAVLFHERHAAQLGCLEAMIVMAHYYLGLPTQLLLDCPIKPVQSDLRSGVDYLWRAAEGGDRRCMILIARYLDATAVLSDPSLEVNKSNNHPGNFLLLPALLTISLDVLPSVSPDSWAESITWYRKAVDSAGTVPDGVTDEGLDAEGRYDAAEDLAPVYRILARMAEMYCVGGFGLKQNFDMAGELYGQAGDLASAACQGRLAANYFDLSEEAYGKVE